MQCMTNHVAKNQAHGLRSQFQNEFTTEGGKLHGAVKPCMEKTNMLDNSKKLVAAAREAGCTIIHCPINFEKVGATDFAVFA